MKWDMTFSKDPGPKMARWSKSWTTIDTMVIGSEEEQNNINEKFTKSYTHLFTLLGIVFSKRFCPILFRSIYGMENKHISCSNDLFYSFPNSAIKYNIYSFISLLLIASSPSLAPCFRILVKSV